MSAEQPSATLNVYSKMAADCFEVMRVKGYDLFLFILGNPKIEEEMKMPIDQRIREIILAEMRGNEIWFRGEKAVVAYARIICDLCQRPSLPYSYELSQRLTLPSYSKELLQSQGRFLQDLSVVIADDSRFSPEERRLIDDCIENVHLLS